MWNSLRYAASMHDLAISNDPYTHTLGLPYCLLEQVYERVKIQETRTCIGLVKVEWLRHDLIAC